VDAGNRSGGNPAGGRTAVCDTSVLLAGGDPRSGPDDAVFVTPAVLDEVRRPEDRERLETLRETGLKVQSPTAEGLRRVEEAAKAAGEGERLSKADKELVALALDLKAELLTDDRSMQNVAATLQVAFRGFAQSEIKGIWHWESQWRCSGCARAYEKEPLRGECTICGHAVKKKHWRVPKGEAAGPKRRPPK
jgi:UPF0271 protein